MKAPVIIAEIGCNHKGNLKTAKEMVYIAKNFCRATVVKFQKRCIKESLTEEAYKAPHPTPYHAYGETYGAHREALEFDTFQHKELFEYCTHLGIDYASSVWDLTSARQIASLNPSFIKVPSACNAHLPMLEFLCLNYPNSIHVSLGMTTRKEEDNIVFLFQKYNRLKDLVFYACTSGYPVEAKDTCLLEISRLKKTYANKIQAIGFSGHHLGIAIDMAAVTLGAVFIERHFTLDRTWKGTDHAASLEPDGLRKLVRDAKAVASALNYKELELLPIELAQRKKLKNQAFCQA